MTDCTSAGPAPLRTDDTLANSAPKPVGMPDDWRSSFWSITPADRSRIVIDPDSTAWVSHSNCGKYLMQSVRMGGSFPKPRVCFSNGPCRKYDCVEDGPNRAAYNTAQVRHLLRAPLVERGPDGLLYFRATPPVHVVHVPVGEVHDMIVDSLRRTAVHRRFEWWAVTRSTGETTFMATGDPIAKPKVRGGWATMLLAIAVSVMSVEDALATYEYGCSQPGVEKGGYQWSKRMHPESLRGSGNGVALGYGDSEVEAAHRVCAGLHEATGVTATYDLTEKEFHYPGHADADKALFEVVRQTRRVMREEAKARRAEDKADPWLAMLREAGRKQTEADVRVSNHLVADAL